MVYQRHSDAQRSGNAFNSVQRYVGIIIAAVYEKRLGATLNPRPVDCGKYKLCVYSVEIGKSQRSQKSRYQKRARDPGYRSFEEAKDERDAQAMPDKYGIRRQRANLIIKSTQPTRQMLTGRRRELGNRRFVSEFPNT